jgi:nicotinamidase-related amidase
MQRLEKDKAILVVVDIQGKLASLMHEKETFYANVVRMIKGADVLGYPIIWNEQLPDKLGETIPQIKEALPNHSPLVKTSFSCCGNDDFVSQLEASGKRHVMVVGMETHICVYQTVFDLLERDYKVWVVADGVSSRIAENKHIGLETMRNDGARITSVEMALFELMGTVEPDLMRQVVQIVK